MDEVSLGPDHAGEVLTLQRAAYVSEAQLYAEPFLPALTQTLDELAAELAGPARGLRDGGRLVAAVRWRTIDGIAHIGRLVVAPDRQGGGLGTRLLRAAQRESGADRFELFTGHLSEANLRLYRREGFVETSRSRLDDRIELVTLQKSR